MAAVVITGAAKCADCGANIGEDNGPPDGWELEDGRTVCQACANKDLLRILDVAAAMYRERIRSGFCAMLWRMGFIILAFVAAALAWKILFE